MRRLWKNFKFKICHRGSWLFIINEEKSINFIYQ